MIFEEPLRVVVVRLILGTLWLLGSYKVMDLIIIINILFSNL